MEITIRLLLVAMVGLITALIVTFLVTGRATGFGDLMDSQSDRAECKLLQEQGETGSEKWNDLGCEEVLSGEGTGSGDRSCSSITTEQACELDRVNCRWTGDACVSS